MLAGGVTKIVLNYILVGNPDINIHGAPVSTLCCYMVIVALNLFFVWKYSPEKPHYLQLFTKPVIASVLMGSICLNGSIYKAADAQILHLNGGSISYSDEATLFSKVINGDSVIKETGEVIPRSKICFK